MNRGEVVLQGTGDVIALHLFGRLVIRGAKDKELGVVVIGVNLPAIHRRWRHVLGAGEELVDREWVRRRRLLSGEELRRRPWSAVLIGAWDAPPGAWQTQPWATRMLTLMQTSRKIQLEMSWKGLPVARLAGSYLGWYLEKKKTRLLMEPPWACQLKHS